jgi:hypothetical protein
MAVSSSLHGGVVLDSAAFLLVSHGEVCGGEHSREIRHRAKENNDVRFS